MTERAAALSSSVGASDPIIGRVINGRFKVTSFLARGGMGKVYRAEQAPLGRVCAVKVLDAHYAGDHDPEFHRRFFLEASVASKLTHPNTVTIFDYGKTEDGIYFMAMEYLEGATLHRAIREAGYFPEERVVHIARQICRALHEAHSLGAIHRDLKPANIFLLAPGDEVDFVKVLDFGLVKNIADTKDDLTQSGFFMGSPKYMAPEQIRGDRVDARADIYALGIILYEMITGKVPFDRPNSVNVLMAHVNEKAPPLRQTNPSVAVSPELEEIVARCMEKLPGDRFRSMDELLSTLKRPGSVGLLATGPLRGGEGGRDVRLASDSVSGPQAVFDRAASGPASPQPRTAHARRSSSPDRGSIAHHVPTTGTAPTPRSTALRGSKNAFVMVAGSALAVAASVAYVAISNDGRRGNDANGSAPRRATPTPEASTAFVATVMPQRETFGSATGIRAATNDVEMPAPREVAHTIRIQSDPAGATVREDGVELCSGTPCDVSYSGPAADPSKTHTLSITRPGYRAELRAAKVGDPEILVRLVRATAARAPSPPAKEEMPAVPTGYKTDIPY